MSLKGESVAVVINSDSLDNIQPDMLYNYFPIHVQEDGHQWVVSEYKFIRSKLVPIFYQAEDGKFIDRLVLKILLPVLYYLIPNNKEKQEKVEGK